MVPVVASPVVTPRLEYAGVLAVAFLTVALTGCSSGASAEAVQPATAVSSPTTGDSDAPAVVEFEVAGSGTADIQFETLEDPQKLSGVSLPWKKTVTAETSVVIPKLSVTSANPDPASELTCMIRIGGDLKRMKTALGENAHVICDDVDNYLN